MTKQSTREGFLGNFRWGSVLRRAAFGGDEPWDTFMSSLRSIPLIIDTEVKVGLSFQRGGTVEKKKLVLAIDFPLDSRPDRAIPQVHRFQFLELSSKPVFRLTKWKNMKGFIGCVFSKRKKCFFLSKTL